MCVADMEFIIPPQLTSLKGGLVIRTGVEQPPGETSEQALLNLTGKNSRQTRCSKD